MLAIPDNVANPSEDTVVSILPLESNPNNLDCLVALAGNVIVAETVSVSNNLTDLSDCCFKSDNIDVIVSSCVFKACNIKSTCCWKIRSSF